MKLIYLIKLISVGFIGLDVCNAHMFMSNPPSRRNKYSSYYLSNDLVDYNIMSPLNVAPYTFPCKGYPKGPSTATINSNSVSVTLEGTAIHGGGHCQFGISYNDRDFLVLKTVLYTCLLDSLTYTFDLPSNTPSGKVTIFWTWINKIGNREYYMECADVNINNGNDKNNGVVLNGKELLVVNLPGYPTIPEWGSSIDPSVTGEELLSQRKDFSIIALSENREENDQNTEIIVSETKTTQSTTIEKTITSSKSATATNINEINNSKCNNGKMRCSKNGGFETCVNNEWVYRDCAVGTQCKGFLKDYIICDFIRN